MSLVDSLHRPVFARRVLVLAQHLADIAPRGARLLDVGCGDGSIDSLMMERRPDLSIEGIDVLVRPQTRIPVRAFDGKHLPYPDGSFDAVSFVDVLHHADDARALLREAARVSRGCVLIKDHLLEGLLAAPTLRLMDWVGNARHGVVLPYHYWSREQWDACFSGLSLAVGEWRSTLGLYPPPLNWVFERSLHFIARLEHRNH
jgi:SAM-dependent methyltransferase